MAEAVRPATDSVAYSDDFISQASERSFEARVEQRHTRSLAEEGITLDVLKQVEQELQLIKLVWPEITAEELKNLPESYRVNTSKEKLLLLYAENFRRQFAFKYPDRKPLLLAAENECGLNKLVCTTIRPTKLPFSELEHWEGCAKFISEHIEYWPQENMTMLPYRICSPTFVLEYQQAQCFEMSTLLCSYLVGCGYLAFVVSGYASRELCQNDQMYVNCPDLDEVEQERPAVEEEGEGKYEMKEPPKLESKFLQAIEQKIIDKQREAEEAEREARRLEIEELEKPPPDELYGLRVHSWVLLLPGAREIEEPLFIDPPSGLAYKVDSSQFCGIESVWNHTNYWVNMQNCGEGCGKIKYDLNNVSCWEHLLVAEQLRRKADGKVFEDDDPSIILKGKHLDTPFESWVQKPVISYESYMQRYPGGHKTILYKKVRVEKYSSFTHKQGIVKSVTVFSDYELKQPEYAVEYYQKRKDCLQKVVRSLTESYVMETFSSGREDYLKFHKYFLSENTTEDSRFIEFYDEYRVDGLSKLEMNPLYLTAEYKNREDKLYYMHGTFESRRRISNETYKRSITKICQKYERDFTKKANDDVAQRLFLLTENQILLKYHYGKNKVTAETKEFIKPPAAEKDRFTFDPKMTASYQVDPAENAHKKLPLYNLLCEMMKLEDDAIRQLRELEDEVTTLLKTRSMEDAFPKLIVSVYDRQRNQKALQGLRDREAQLQKLTAEVAEKELDYLAPYLNRRGWTRVTSDTQASVLRTECLDDLKKLLVSRANKLEEALHKTEWTIQTSQKWFEEFQDSITPAEEEDYFERLNDLLLQQKAIEITLDRHRVIACNRYKLMERYLDSDPRLINLIKRR